MSALTCGFIGLGLIGGSIAKALRASLPDTKIIVFDINKDTLLLAKEDGVADCITTKIDASFAECDYVFLCAPVSKNDENLKTVAGFLSDGCIITDVGSVKTGIHEKIQELGLAHRFIGGHPMAGSERVGYINAKALLLENAYYILTPEETVSKDMLEDYKTLVRSIGAIPLVLEAKTHDYVTAAVSHLPHVIASSLVNLVKDADSADGIMKMIAAGGFKDITRIASSSPTMWQQICLTNTDNIAALLDAYIEALVCVRKKLSGRNADALYEFFETARDYRDSFIDASSGPIKKSFSITVDIRDETGALAAIATILALNNISIKNIGIVHNRELEEGTLRIEFYDETSIEQAVCILRGKGYIAHIKN